jgi:hypothetical protein
VPTSHELKRLSDIDDQDGLWFYILIIQFYRRSELMSAWDPAPVIRDAVVGALVHYYPFAEQGYRCRSYAGGCLRQRFSPHGQVEVVEVLLNLTDIGLRWSTAVWSFATMNSAVDR